MYMYPGAKYRGIYNIPEYIFIYIHIVDYYFGGVSLSLSTDV